MADAINSDRQLSGTPAIAINHGKPFEDEVMRRLGAVSKTTANEWNRSSSDDSECELPRYLILERELTDAGVYLYHARGEILLANGESGDLALRVYTYSDPSGADPDPAIALGSMSLALTHTVSMANPGASSGLGMIEWDFELSALGTGTQTNLQTWSSEVRYKRHTTDARQKSEDGGKLAIDFHRDTIIVATAQKLGAWTGAGTGRVNFYAHSAWVRNGMSGQA